MAATFQDAYGVLELVAAQLHDDPLLEGVEDCRLFSLPKTNSSNIINQTFIALGQRKKPHHFILNKMFFNVFFYKN